MSDEVSIAVQLGSRYGTSGGSGAGESKALSGSAAAVGLIPAPSEASCAAEGSSSAAHELAGEAAAYVRASAASSHSAAVRPGSEELRKVSQAWENSHYNEGIGRDDIFDKLREECGVFGVFGTPNASSLSYYGLHALQHRGEESSGVCTVDSATGGFAYHRGMGLVKEVFTSDILDSLPGDRAIGHVRYSTSGASQLGNAQPLVFKYRDGDLAVATNGNIVNAPSIRRELEQMGSIFQTTSDTEVIAHLIARSPKDFVSAAKDALKRIIGGFAFLIMTNERLLVASDPNGLRPLVMGRLGEGYVFASETCAFETIGAEYVRDVQPGELLILDKEGMREDRFDEEDRRASCAMEYIYFARPDSDINEVNIHTARKQMGRTLAVESFVDADIVVGVPDSSISAAIGYAEQTGIPYEMGLIKNKYSGRTFIQPSQELREKGVKMKLSAVRKIVQGKRVVMIDDSIVRGTTSLRIVNMLREAGAKEVHVRISSPPFANPCYYGIDTPDRRELIASSKTVEEIREAINADSLYFLSAEGLIESASVPGDSKGGGLCLACFTNEYPTPVDENSDKSCSC
ncbi:amidophosphoribosyltransferase [Paenibacillus pasadenensis]|uniref:amidophosphoribosyltransferase n=1 Tax=Paenibacillus pasadenensis TaxID=217090 RepID=UPI0020419D85|nr:amidophosphoribosyltransferase [Paenibacillus pasadenensis]MCM3749304.1 amidophosphoribosyltransferase [Paenibacillus pasadenensis]